MDLNLSQFTKFIFVAAGWVKVHWSRLSPDSDLLDWSRILWRIVVSGNNVASLFVTVQLTLISLSAMHYCSVFCVADQSEASQNNCAILIGGERIWVWLSEWLTSATTRVEVTNLLQWNAVQPGRWMMHQTTVATICTPAMEKVMASWDLGDTREGRAADLLAILEMFQS